MAWKWTWVLAVLLCLSCSNDTGTDEDKDGFDADVDCNDADPTVHPRADETAYDGIDQDCDGSDLTDADGDGSDAVATGGDDCDDEDGTIFPTADETPYDGIDQDCSGADLTDVDADSFDSVDAGGDDCDDADDSIYPSRPEVCGDRIDQDCSGADLACDESDDDLDGFSEAMGDCNDTNGDIHPDATEVPYNGQDDDCDPDTRDDDLDGDGFRFLGAGDCDDEDASVFPGAEEVPYDGIDQDCSGSDLSDVDRDGVVSCMVTSPPDPCDCHDQRADVNPGVAEIPHDGVDQNCDGSDYIGEPSQLTTDPGSQTHPDVAWGSSEYLIVWLDGRSGSNEIYGRFVGLDGLPTGDEFVIGAAAATGTPTPRVASSGSGYLVVWDGNGQLLDESGAPTMPLASVGGARDARLAFSGGTYMLVWRDFDSAGPGWDMALSRTIAPDGTQGTVYRVHVAAELTYFTGPTIASDGTNFLVMWQRDVNPWAPTGRSGSYGRLMQPDGTPLDVEFRIGSHAGQLNAASDGTNFLAALSTGDVRGQFLDGVGAAIFTPVGSPITISNALGSQTAAKVAYIGGSFIVQFNDTRWPVPALYQQQVAPDSTLLGSPSIQNEPFFVQATAPSSHKIVSAGATGLSAWDSDGDIYVNVVMP